MKICSRFLLVFVLVLSNFGCVNSFANLASKNSNALIATTFSGTIKTQTTTTDTLFAELFIVELGSWSSFCLQDTSKICEFVNMANTTETSNNKEVFISAIPIDKQGHFSFKIPQPFTRNLWGYIPCECGVTTKYGFFILKIKQDTNEIKKITFHPFCVKTLENLRNVEIK
jgi:hypothetical protein